MAETQVVNIEEDEFDVYIGRGTVWGNPFHSRAHGREVAIERYERHIEDEISEGNITRQEILALRGQRLGCHCKPRACHGDVIVKLVEAFSPKP